MVVSVDVDIRLSRQKIAKALYAAAKKGTGDVADRIVEIAKAKARVKTGTLERSISRDPVYQEGESFVTDVGARKTQYAASVEWGSGERGEPIGSTYIGPFGTISGEINPPGKKAFGKYPIRPISKQYLRFTVNGRTVFAKEVWHPGVRARPFLRPAMDSIRMTEARYIWAERIKTELLKSLGVAP